MAMLKDKNLYFEEVLSMTGENGTMYMPVAPAYVVQNPNCCTQNFGFGGCGGLTA